MRKIISHYLLATFIITTTFLFIFFTFSGHGQNNSVESQNNTANNRKRNMNKPVIKKIIDSYNNSDKLYLFHFGSMTCAPCLQKFERFQEGSGPDSDKYRQVIVILLEEDKKEFNKRFDFSKFGIDVFCYNEKGFTVEELRELGDEDIGFSLLYDGTGGYLTDDEETMNNYIFGYKLGFITAQLKYNPTDFDAHYEWGQLLDGKGRHSEAIVELELCRKMNPDHIDARALLATVYYRAEMYEKGVEELESIIPKASGQMQEFLKNSLTEFKKFWETSKEMSKSNK